MENERLRLELFPDCGGKIGRLLDRRYGHDWFWQNPHLPRRCPVWGQSYIRDLDSGGWDEIFPSVHPCEISVGTSFVPVPDHGELVYLPWTSAGNATESQMQASGRNLHYHFQRTLVLHKSGVTLSYHVQNTGLLPFPWLWCAHPLFPFDQNLEVRTDARFDVTQATGVGEALLGKQIRWDDLPPRTRPWAVKLFSAKSAADKIHLRHTCGSELTMRWDSGEIPYLGLWVNNGGWSGCESRPYFNLGVEPAMLPFDALSSASRPPILAPGEHRQWALHIDMNP